VEIPQRNTPFRRRKARMELQGIPADWSLPIRYDATGPAGRALDVSSVEQL
jgi:hypothetical protein